jgi:transcriptional regulator with XRE-family HTH domain
MAKTKKSRAGEAGGAAATERPTKDPQLVDFGRRLRALRDLAGLTQEDLAFAAGLHWTYIGQVERGERNLTYKSLLRLAVGLQVPPAELMPGDGGTRSGGGGREAGDKPGLDAGQSEALSLLAAGSTPQEAAETLGVSLPEFRQLVVGAQRRLGVRSLEQAVGRVPRP